MCCHCSIGDMNRREFLGAAAAGVTGAGLAAAWPSLAAGQIDWQPEKPIAAAGKTLRVQPVLMYRLYKPRPARSWRPWGGLQNEQDVAEEMNRIGGELKLLSQKAEFPLEILPLAKVTSKPEAAAIRDKEKDTVMLVYAATGDTETLESCVSDDKHNLIFIRHRSGPVYLWYEIVHCRFLRKGGEGFILDTYRDPAGMTIHDVVVDDYDELLVKLRALNGVNNFIGKRIVALGGAGGWCCEESPGVAREKFNIDIKDVSYDELGRRIKAARADKKLVNKAEKWATKYLSLPDTKLKTKKEFVSNAFVLYATFKDLMKEHGTDAFTIKECMSTVMPISETTACLPLSLINDEGDLAFCESDFNCIPSGILLHHISGLPVFLNDPTYPHHAMVTCAHCTAPRRMDGKNYARARIVTHFESDYGATPKVDYPKGTRVTMICPDSGQKEWVGFTGNIIDSPFYDICRSQYDIEVDGDWKKLLQDMRGFHWNMAVGDFSRELEYACRKIGVNWVNVSEGKIV